MFHVVYFFQNIFCQLFQIILPIIADLLMGLSFSLPKDSTDIIPLKLDMYRYSKAFYSSNENTIGQKYKDVVKYFGGIPAERTASDTSVSNGKC